MRSPFKNRYKPDPRMSLTKWITKKSYKEVLEDLTGEVWIRDSLFPSYYTSEMIPKTVEILNQEEIRFAVNRQDPDKLQVTINEMEKYQSRGSRLANDLGLG